MSYQAYRKQILCDRLERKTEQWNSIQDAIDAVSGKTKKNVSLDTGDGRIAYAYMSLDDLLKFSDILERQIDSYFRKIHGRGVVMISLRRHG